MKKLILFVAAAFIAQYSQAQWEPDVRLTNTPDSSLLHYTNKHSLACKGDTVHVVWFEKFDNNWEIFYVRSTDGGNNWESETRLTETETSSKYPNISVSGSDVYVAWEEYIEGNREIFFKRSVDRGSTWGESVRLTYDPFISYFANIASKGSYVHLGWVTRDLAQQTWKIYYMHSSDGGNSWNTEVWISPNSLKAIGPSIALSGSDVHFTWSDYRNLDLPEIYYRKSSDNGDTWGPETRLTNDLDIQQLPSIAASGNSVNIAWHDKRNGLDRIFFKGSKDGGENWSEDIQVTEDFKTCFNVSLAYSDSVLHLVYADLYDINYNFSVDGGNSWNESKLLNDISFNSNFPSIAVSGPVLHVIWRDLRDYNFEIYYKRNPTGGVTTGIPTIETQYRIYPNPLNNQLLNIELPLDNNTGIEVTLYNLTGEIIFQQLKFGAQGTNMLNLKLPNVAAGLYFLQIKYAGKIINTKLVVK